MSDSPYQSPQTSSWGTPDPGREPLRRVAKYQRFVIFALLANILANIVSFATVGQEMPIRLVVMVLSLGIAVFAMVSVFLLAREVINTGVGVLCAILMIVPCNFFCLGIPMGIWAVVILSQSHIRKTFR